MQPERGFYGSNPLNSRPLNDSDEPDPQAPMQ
jgi:hypothetical protein